MQLFATDPCPILSAQALDDSRVVNQCRETAQIACTAFHTLSSGMAAIPYRPAHPHHPVTLWAQSDHRNLAWVLAHLRALGDEYRHRYPIAATDHLSIHEMRGTGLLDWGRDLPPPLSFQNCAANRALGLDFTHLEDVHLAYQLYLRWRWAGATRTPRWTRRGIPLWAAGPTYAQSPSTPEGE